MRIANWAVAALAAIVALLAPALWNGFPLLEYDTGGYLARWYEGYLVPSRSTVYGLFAVAGWPLDFWPIVVLQAIAVVWVLALVLRSYGFGGRPWTLLAVIVTLALTTTLSWIAGILLTDVFAGLAVLALHLVVMRPDTLSRIERLALILFIAFCGATHSATFAVLLGLALVAFAAALSRRRIVTLIGALRGAVAVGLAAVMLLAANFALSGQFAWTPGGYGIVFARMLEDGIVARYLDAHCGDESFKLCAYRHRLPPTADDFLWAYGSIFDKLGRFKGLGDEMRTIVLGSLVDYPGEQLETALAASGRQLISVGTGEGVVNTLAHTYGIIEHYMPSVAPAMRAARQQHGDLHFAAINAVHVPVALATMALLPLLLALGLRQRDYLDIGLLAATVTLALLGNAVVCGTLSNPHDRYGARLAWVPLMVAALVVLRRQSVAGEAQTRIVVAPSSARV
ncbi:MAG TPA: hypothetical protein VKX28_15070 [Xanthobacteraceae bacterium]|nr:hypothetical protein [Xanthobacteraceae bacterium]